MNKRILSFLVVCAFALTVPSAPAAEVRSTALSASLVIRNNGGGVYRIDGYNSKASGQYILVMSASSLPSNGAVTLLYPPIYVPANSNFSLFVSRRLTSETGIVVANSSTAPALTSGSADCFFYADKD